MLSRQRRWQLKQQAQGRCSLCGQKRGRKATRLDACEPCRLKQNARSLARYHAEQAELKRYREGQS